MNKKIVIILGIVVCILILVFLVVRASLLTQKDPLNITPTQTNGTDISSQPTFNPSTPVEPTVTLKPDLNQELEDQSKADREYGEIIQQQYTDYPWLEKLPLQTENYFIYFDTNEKKFFGQLYKTENQDQTKAEIINKLKELGIAIEQYEIVWQ